jgi:hypothetical protein
MRLKAMTEMMVSRTSQPAMVAPVIRPSMTPRIVFFPAPFGPRNPKIEPRGTTYETPVTFHRQCVFLMGWWPSRPPALHGRFPHIVRSHYQECRREEVTYSGEDVD